jgi:hypothetical protein
MILFFDLMKLEFYTVNKGLFLDWQVSVGVYLYLGIKVPPSSGKP